MAWFGRSMTTPTLQVLREAERGLHQCPDRATFTWICKAEARRRPGRHAISLHGCVSSRGISCGQYTPASTDMCARRVPSRVTALHLYTITLYTLDNAVSIACKEVHT
jgi:hypothetical protein